MRPLRRLRTAFVGRFRKAQGVVGGLATYENELVHRLQTAADTQYVRAKPVTVPQPVRRIFSLFGRDPQATAQDYPVVLPELDVELVHLADQTLAPALLLQRRVPTVVMVHDLIPYLRKPVTKGSARVFERLIRIGSIRGLRRATRLLCNSAFTKAQMVEYLGMSAAQIDVTPLGVDHQMFRPQLEGESFRRRWGLDRTCQTVLFVGSLTRRKNLGTVWRAVALLEQHLEVQIVVVAPPNREETLEAEWGRLPQLRRSVCFLTGLPSEHLPLLYNSANLLVLPSLYEGFGLPALEAMACGCPVIAARRGALPEILGDAGILVDATDVPAWSEAIGSVLTDNALQSQLRSRSLCRAAEFTWERSAASTIDAYHKVVG